MSFIKLVHNLSSGVPGKAFAGHLMDFGKKNVKKKEVNAVG